MFLLVGYVLVLAAVGTALLTLLAIRLGQRWGVLDHPGERKQHAAPIPLTGGWAVYAVFATAVWIPLLGLQWMSSAQLDFLQGLPGLASLSAWKGLASNFTAKLLPVFASATLVFLIGARDDRRNVPPWIRILAPFLGGLILAVSGIRPHLGFLPAELEILIGAFWIAGITNAFNLIDGLDGLCAGVSATATLALLLISLIFEQPLVTLLCAVLLGTELGFLVHNTHPARVFLGSSGSLLWGHLHAIASILVIYNAPSRGMSNPLAPLLCPLLLLAVPLYDTLSVVAIRLRQRRPIARGDRSHFHHRLLRVGFSQRQVMVFICTVSALSGMNAVLLTQATPLQTALLLVQSLAVFTLIALSESVAARKNAKAERILGIAETRKPAPVKTDSLI